VREHLARVEDESHGADCAANPSSLDSH
jgi:hypothetical protein